MSFRRNSSESRRWQLWLSSHREELLSCGIPIALLESEHLWLYFLDHGYYRPEGIAEPIIDIDQLSASQADRLRNLLELSAYYRGCHALTLLQHRHQH